MIKILFLIQIGNEFLVENVMNKVIQYNTSDNYYCISILNTIDVDIGKFNLKNVHVMSHDNIGMDIGPFLLQLKWMINMDFDYVYKIHTKTNQKWFDELTDIEFCNENIVMNNKWKCDIDVRNMYHINKICHDFKIPNIWYDELYDISYNINDIDVDFYSSYYDVKINKNDYVTHLLGYDINKQFILQHAIENKHALNKSQIKVKQRHKIHFCGGSIFIIKFALLQKFAKQIDIDKLYLCLESGYSNNDESTYVHALERIISSFFL